MNFDIISSIKEFFFDIVGYLIPGFIILTLINLVYGIYLPFEIDSLVALILSYILGYIVYSISLFKAIFIKNWPKIFLATSREEIEKKLLSLDTVVLAKEYINSKVNKNEKKLENFRSLRNVAMSKSPDSDKKIYTFMFRAELFDQLHTISILSLITSIVLLILSFWGIHSQYELFDYLMIGIFILLIMTLRKGWQRFFEIAMSLPFSLYLTNQSHKNEN